MIGRKAGREAPLAGAQSKLHTPWPVPASSPVLEQNPSEKNWVGTRGQAGLGQVSGRPHPDLALLQTWVPRNKSSFPSATTADPLWSRQREWEGGRPRSPHLAQAQGEMTSSRSD